MMNEQLQGELLSVHENSQIYPGAPTDISPHGAVDYLGYWTPGESMHEQINFDLLGQRCLVFGDVAVTHFTDEIYFVLPIPLPLVDFGLGYHVVTNRPIPYATIRSISVVRKRQWWALVMGLIFAPLWFSCLAGSLFAGDWREGSTWGIAAFAMLWLVIMGLFPLWLFYRGRSFLAVASDSDVICLPMDRNKAQIRRAFELLKERVTSPQVRWEIQRV